MEICFSDQKSHAQNLTRIKEIREEHLRGKTVPEIEDAESFSSVHTQEFSVRCSLGEIWETS